jgi:phospholipid transport system substrate-binding protein
MILSHRFTARMKYYPGRSVGVGPWLIAFLAALVIALAMLAARAVHAADVNPAESFVQQNVDRGYAILSNTALSDEQRHLQFRDFMLSLTDTRRIGMFTLGPYANSASKEDLEAFIAAFSDYTVGFIHGVVFAQTRGQTPKVTGSVQRAADDVVVNCEVVNPKYPNAPPIKAAFRVRKATDGRSIVTDIQVEGIWLALVQRSDFTGFLQQHGGRISELTSDLQRHTSGPEF